MRTKLDVIAVVHLPTTFRVLSVHQRVGKTGFVCTTATLIHREGQLRVFWASHAINPALRPGVRVAPRWLSEEVQAQGITPIDTLQALGRGSCRTATSRLVTKPKSRSLQRHPERIENDEVCDEQFYRWPFEQPQG